MLYAILIEHVDPIPLDDETDEQVAKSISKVPSRSDGPSLHMSEGVQDLNVHSYQCRRRRSPVCQMASRLVVL